MQVGAVRRTGLAALAAALVSCGFFAGDPWPRWTAAVDQAFAAADQANTLGGVEVNGVFVATPASTQRQIRDIATDARAVVAAAAPPSGAEGFKDELLKLLEARGSIADARARDGGDAASLDAREKAWRDDFASLRSRYAAWRATQGR